MAPFKTVKLGGSDLEVPIICLGTMTWGEQNTEAEAHEQLDYALGAGVNFIDTAELYPVPPGPETQTRTEVYIGNWLKSRGCRDKVIIATKVASVVPGMDRSFIVNNRFDPPGTSSDQPDLSLKQVKEACEGSLRRLQTEYIDLYQVHWPNRYVPVFGKRQYQQSMERPYPAFDETVQAMGELIKEGKIKYWGLSNESTFGVCQVCETCKRLGVPLPVSIQNDFSPVFRFFEEELAEACSPLHYNIHLLAYGPLAGGTLSGKYLGGAQPEGARHTKWPGFQPRYHNPATMEAAKLYADLAARKGITPSQLALAWCATRWYMGSVIIGATTMAQLKENIEAFHITLDEDTLKEMDDIHMKIRNPNATD